jgi:hypothetical protein
MAAFNGNIGDEAGIIEMIGGDKTKVVRWSRSMLVGNGFERLSCAEISRCTVFYSVRARQGHHLRSSIPYHAIHDVVQLEKWRKQYYIRPLASGHAEKITEAYNHFA